MKKKNFAIIVCLVIVISCLAGCAGKESTKEEPTIDDIYQANLTETLLQKYDTVSNTTKIYIDGDYGYEIDSAVKENYLYTYFDRQGEYEYFETDIAGRVIRLCSKDGGGVAKQIVDCDSAFFEENVMKDYTVFSFGYVENEHIESSTKNGDLTTIVTSMDKETAEEVSGSNLPDMNDGDKLIDEYTMDTETLELRSISTYVLRKDGTKQMYMETTFAYNQSFPEAPAEYQAAFSGADTRVLTFKIDAGTEEEEILTSTVSVGVPVQFHLPEGYAMYSDAECTQAYEYDMNEQDDVTLYLVKEM